MGTDTMKIPQAILAQAIYALNSNLAVMGVRKRPATVVEEVLGHMDPAEFKGVFFDTCRTPHTLAYPLSGGRRPELAIQCAAWARNAKRFKCKFLKEKKTW